MTQDWLEQNLALVIAVAAIEITLKGIALWKAARAGSKAWFVTLLVINSAGILPIAYIFFLSKERTSQSESDK